MWCLEFAYILAKLTYRYACKSIWRCIVYKVDNKKRDINDSDCDAAQDDDEYIWEWWFYDEDYDKDDNTMHPSHDKPSKQPSVQQSS